MSTLQQRLLARFSRLQGTSARLLDALPSPVHHQLTRLLGHDSPHHELDSHLHVVLAVRKRLGGGSGLVRQDAALSRKIFHKEMLSIRGQSTRVGTVKDLTLNTRTAPLKARLYRPASLTGDTLPTGDSLLVFYHGGGFVVGDLETHDEPCRLICQQADISVLSVEYRLAPEFPAPTAVHDCVAALEWAHDQAAELGINPAKIAVGGDSAGGNLAATVAQQARDTAFAPVAQLLIYPVVDFLDDYPSHAAYDSGLFLDRLDMDNAKAAYLGNSGLKYGDPIVSPLRGIREELAPALVITAALDVLRDEGELYAQRLRQHGNQVALRRIAGQGHGFINITSINKGARFATIQLARDFRQLLDGELL